MENSMLDKLKNLKEKAADVASSAAVAVGDLNGDGKVDKEDLRIASDWAKKTTSSVGTEALKLGKAALQSDLVKDTAAGAAVGAAIALPIPVIGPATGAVIGAGLGVYKNITKKEQRPSISADASKPSLDVHAELLKLDELKQKNIITQSEFDEQKTLLLEAQRKNL
jgi:phage-related tail protein